jgi:Flp pilus assembly protein TadD
MLKRILPLAAWLALGAFALGAAAQTAPGDMKRLEEPAPELTEPTLYEFLLGEIALQRGDNALAAKTYLDLAKRTRDPRVARRAVEVAKQGELPELALQAARTWQSIEPDSTAALFELSQMLIVAKKVDEAAPYLQKLLATPGVDVERAYLQLNRLLAANPDKAANLRVMRSLAARHPQLAQSHFAVAQAAIAANDERTALAEVRRAAELRPEWEAPALLEAQILQKRSPGDAARRLGQFVEKNPESREARLNYARALVLDKRLPEARKQLETLLAANPGNTDVIYAVGLVAFQLKDYETAEASMKRLLDSKYRDPDQARFMLGQIAEEQKQWPRAIQWYDTIKDGEQAIPARVRTAAVMAKDGKLEDARTYLHRVSADNPDQEVQLTVAEAQILRDASRNSEAFDLLGSALARSPDQPELLYDYALTAEKLERFDLLESNLRKLITVRPDHAHAYNALGYSFAERNQRLPEARKLIERALELSPEDSFIIDSMGWVQYREGDLKGAASTLRRAYDGRPDAEIGAHLGEVLWKLGDRSEANRVWQESLKSAPDNETLLKTIKRLKK